MEASMIPIIAAVAAVQISAQKAVGSIIILNVVEFNALLKETDAPLIAVSNNFWGGKKYLFNHKGLTFYCKTSAQIFVPSNAKMINCKSIHIPYS